MFVPDLTPIFRFIGLVFLAMTILLIFFGVKTIKNRKGKRIIESKVKIQPDYKLVTDGKTVDTVWIYKLPKK